jgi:hypothetical protein
VQVGHPAPIVSTFAVLPADVHGEIVMQYVLSAVPAATCGQDAVP